jgi:hypothetical protein
MNLPIEIPQQAVVLLRLRVDPDDVHLGTGCYLGWQDRSGAVHETEVSRAQMTQLTQYLSTQSLEFPLYLS